MVFLGSGAEARGSSRLKTAETEERHRRRVSGGVGRSDINVKSLCCGKFKNRV